MRVLVIGGAGLTGPFVVQELHDLGHEVVIAHRGQTEIVLPEGVRHIHLDHERFREHAEELRDVTPDVVLDMMPLNGEIARTTMDVFRGVARRVVAISSVDVYRAYDVLWRREEGPIQLMPLTEGAELRASRCPDGGDRENILVEEVVMGDAELPGTILRYPMVYGPNDGGRIASDLKRMIDGRPAILLDERLAAWRWTRGYAENCAHAAVLAVTTDRAAGRIYNVGEIDALPMSSWIASVGEAAEWSGKILPLPSEQLPPHLVAHHNFTQDWVADTGRIRAELGYQEIVDRAEAVKRTVSWWKEALRSGSPHLMDTLPRAEDYEAEDAVLEQR